MSRSARVDVGGEYYHVINRANGRLQIFNTPEDYFSFEALLRETKELVDMRILAYVVMPNHWHLVLHPKKDGDLAIFMHRLSNAHTRKVHAFTETSGAGHLYQGRYKSFLVDSDAYMLTLIRYVERNPVRAGLVSRCEEWRWGSAWRRSSGTSTFLTESPTALPDDYSQWVNTPDTAEHLAAVRSSVKRGRPFGRDRWVDAMVDRFSLQSTVRVPGRPKKK